MKLESETILQFTKCITALLKCNDYQCSKEFQVKILQGLTGIRYMEFENEFIVPLDILGNLERYSLMLESVMMHPDLKNGNKAMFLNSYYDWMITNSFPITTHDGSKFYENETLHLPGGKLMHISALLKLSAD